MSISPGEVAGYVAIAGIAIREFFNWLSKQQRTTGNGSTGSLPVGDRLSRLEDSMHKTRNQVLILWSDREERLNVDSIVRGSLKPKSRGVTESDSER